MSDDQERYNDITPPNNSAPEIMFERVEKYLCHADDFKSRSVIGAVMGYACSCGLAQVILDYTGVSRNRGDSDKK
jgi:hypothetical protein